MTIVQGNVALGRRGSKGSRVSTLAHQLRRPTSTSTCPWRFGFRTPPPIRLSGSLFSSRHADGSDRSAVACGTRARHERGLGHRAPGPACGPTNEINDAARLANRFFGESRFDFYVDPRNFDPGRPLSLALSPRRWVNAVVLQLAAADLLESFHWTSAGGVNGAGVRQTEKTLFLVLLPKEAWTGRRHTERTKKSIKVAKLWRGMEWLDGEQRGDRKEQLPSFLSSFFFFLYFILFYFSK